MFNYTLLGKRIPQVKKPTQNQLTRACSFVFVNYRTQWITKVLFFGAVSVWVSWLCIKYLRNRWTDLRQIHMFGPSVGWVWRSKSKVKGQGHRDKQRHFSALSVACVRFVFRKISLVSSFYLVSFGRLDWLLVSCRGQDGISASYDVSQ